MSVEKSLGGKKSKSKKSKSKSKKHKIRHIGIEPADNGGFNVRHQYDQGGPEDEAVPDSTHALSDPSQLLAHLQDTVGGQLPGAGAAGPGAAGPAPAGPGAPPQGA